MPKLKDFLAQKNAQEISQETEQEKVITFHLEQFLKTHKRKKMGRHTWKLSRQCDGKQQE